jgi:type III secretory pathway component EscT
VHILAGTLGTFVSPLFHTFHLFMVHNISPVAKNVWNAITKHWDQLLIT